MSDLKKGMVAGGVATAAISLAMLLIQATGLEPQLQLTHLLLTLLDAPSEYVLGWLAHIVIGSVVLGGLFVHVEPRLGAVGSSRVDLQACKLEYSIVSPK